MDWVKSICVFHKKRKEWKYVNEIKQFKGQKVISGGFKALARFDQWIKSLRSSGYSFETILNMVKIMCFRLLQSLNCICCIASKIFNWICCSVKPFYLFVLRLFFSGARTAAVAPNHGSLNRLLWIPWSRHQEMVQTRAITRIRTILGDGCRWRPAVRKLLVCEYSQYFL